MIVVGITVGLVVVEPHLSASIILLSLSAVMLFVGGVQDPLVYRSGHCRGDWRNLFPDVYRWLRQ